MVFLTVARDDENRRLDRVLRKAFPRVPPGALAGAVRRGAVRVNGRRCRNETRVHEGDILKVPAWETPEEEPTRSVRYRDRCIQAGSWRIPVIDRSTNWLVLNKPAGLAVHGAESLDLIVRSVARDEGWWSESLSFRPGPVHRLDRNTSGVQLFALSTEGARALSEQLSRREVFKLYLAVVQGILEEERETSLPLRYDNRRRRTETADVGAPDSPPPSFSAARTAIIPLAHSLRDRFTLVAAIPYTGRTHQIRGHCAAIGHPLAGDRKYGAAPAAGAGAGGTTYLLHSLLMMVTTTGTFWNAPLPGEARIHLERQFPALPALPALARRIREVVQATCTVTGVNGTIEL
ncbi:MAG: RluA family pseudouridine synthase [Spirochaetaceae bacterium]|nr:MAG: RluA family pseudouridine synthase [Spirochaetaceae bacterium]